MKEVTRSNVDIYSMGNKDLFRLYDKTRNKDVRELLIEKHLYLAKILSRKYINKGVEYDDIFQVASLALIYAIDRYDISREFEFSSFATPTIVGEIKKYFRDKVWTLRVPRRIQELIKKVNNAKLYLEQENKRRPKVKDIADYLEVTEEAVLEAMEASYGYSPMSLDMPSNENSEDKDITLADHLGKKDRNFDEIERQDFIDGFLQTLNELEKKIFNDRFVEDKTQSLIAKEIGVSQMTISRLEKKIISKLQKEYKKIN